MPVLQPHKRNYPGVGDRTIRNKWIAAIDDRRFAASLGTGKEAGPSALSFPEHAACADRAAPAFFLLRISSVSPPAWHLFAGQAPDIQERGLRSIVWSTSSHDSNVLLAILPHPSNRGRVDSDV